LPSVAKSVDECEENKMQRYESIPSQPILASVQRVEEAKDRREPALRRACRTKLIERYDFAISPARVTVVAQIVGEEVISLMRWMVVDAMEQLDTGHDPMNRSHIIQE
jgi:hypothetical protein